VRRVEGGERRRRGQQFQKSAASNHALFMTSLYPPLSIPPSLPPSPPPLTYLGSQEHVVEGMGGVSQGNTELGTLLVFQAT